MGFVFLIGLDATGPFFSRYGAALKELDFSIMTFLWNEKYGHKLGSIEGKQLDYFCEPASLKEARCLIWLLEEHRDKFPALQNALDEFFDIMGMWTCSLYLILEKISQGSSLLKYLKKIMKIIMVQLAYLGKLVLRIVIFLKKCHKAFLLCGVKCCRDIQMDTLHGLYTILFS